MTLERLSHKRTKPRKRGSDLKSAILFLPVTNSPAEWQLAILILGLLAIWSVIFLHTFVRPFEWDDLHLIRHYSYSELVSSLYGQEDPDRIETPALRPVATLLFHFQGTVFGENMILQRAFMVVLMGALLWTMGLLLREVGLSFAHILIIFALFVSSRVFASLVLWITNGALILTYICITLSTLFYLRWMKQGPNYLLALTFIFAALATFTREEAYTLPVALPLVWWLATRDHTDYRRLMIGLLGISAIITFHYLLRSILIVGAPQPGLNLSGAKTAIFSALLPGGVQASGLLDHLLQVCWILFLACTAFAFFRMAARRQHQLVVGICLLGLVLSSPALAVPRSFGVALPALAFFTAIAVAIVEICRYVWLLHHDKGVLAKAIIVCLIGLTLGVVSGIRRSVYVAEALDENSLEAVLHNGAMLFGRPATIPAERRQHFMAYMSALGITSHDDWTRLIARRQDHSLTLTPPMFREKYGYLSF